MEASGDTRLAELLDRWEEAAERGEDLDPAELCADAPELLNELTRHIVALKAMQGRLRLETQNPAASRRRADTKHGATLKTESTYSHLQLLSQGGLGIVYRASDVELHRDVVLKFIHGHISSSEEHRAMFRRESEVTSRLDHPGVVPVYGIGDSEGGRPFYVMRYIQGETLDDAIDRLHVTDQAAPRGHHGLELRNLLARFVVICKTIAYAHNRGIIHRDIKPANIMLGRYGETLVVDWGLATPVGRDERFRQSGEQTLLPSDSDKGQSSDNGAGTPAYMSPEAAANDTLLTPAADIYSLGATLYKLLTGRSAFDSPGIQQLRQQVIQGDFPPPTWVRRGVSKTLEAICLKAMAKDPQNRYGTALELAVDIERYLADEPVSAYDEPLLRRGARWARRHRHAAQAILAGISLLAVVTVLSALWLGYLARSEREARVAAESAKQQSLRMSAKFAARTIAGQIDLRWRILEAAAKDAAIKKALVEIDAAPRDTSLWEPAQGWLNEQFIQLQNDHALEFNSLFLLDTQGTQVARAPLSDSIGNSYAFRDYYHGRGHDLAEETRTAIEPIKDVNLSATYSSSTSGTLKVAFTVPIHAGQAGRQEVIGVLGMSVDLGGFGILQTDLQSGQMVVLVDSRRDAVDGEVRRGLILQHPRFAWGQTDQTTRLGQSTVEQIDAAAAAFLFQDYRDPLASGTWLAAFEPVIVDGRRSPVAETGWIVVVQERADKD